MKYIAEDMGLIKSGTKKEVINRILEHVSISKVKEFRVREEKVEPQPKKAEIPKKVKLRHYGRDCIEVLNKNLKWLYIVKIRRKTLRDGYINFCLENLKTAKLPIKFILKPEK
ncbi:MAG: hypothetical protein DRN88_05850 [Candidatus Hydrothermarchaeota archaeon]|nr:MAG: hypothetical protein DRN88_05850 [Candidatus Hydrothermarchaeota archaeon]